LSDERHVLVQFREPVGETDVSALRERGVQVVGFVPNNAVLARLPSGASIDPGGNIRWVGILSPEDKLSRRLDLASTDMNALVFLHSVTDHEVVREALLGAGLTILENSPIGAGVFHVRGSGPQIRTIAGLDRISFIHSAPQRAVDGKPLNVCPGPLTPYGSLPEFAAEGDGWDGPGQGNTQLLRFFENGTPDASGEKTEVLAAMDLWAKYIQLDWGEAPAAGLPHTMDITWAAGNHGDGSPFDGPATGAESNVLAHCFFPAPPNPETIAGDLHFDEAETWRVGTDIDVFTIALHEIGHGLGLNHSEDENAVMAPSYTEPAADLREDDIQGIRSLYASRSTARTSAPAFTPVSGAYPSPIEVRLQYGSGSNSSNTRIYYTLNGSEPTQYSYEFIPGTDYIFQRYSNTIRARAFRQGQLPSEVVTASYSLTQATPVVATPVISPNGGSYTGAVQISISTATDGATIRYTLDGSDPSEAATPYSGPLNMSASVLIRARAYKSGFAASQAVSAGFQVFPSPPAPVFNPPAGVYSSTFSVTMSVPTVGASIRYTTDGSAPTASSTQYTGPVSISTTTTLKAAAFTSGGDMGAVGEAAYTIGTAVATPTITPNGGGFTNSVEVSISTVTPDAVIRYTTNGTDPTLNSTLYTSPFVLGSGSYTVRARAFRAGLSPSAVQSATFQVYFASTVKVFTPTMTPFNGQVFVNAVTISMDCRTEGATIRWSVGTNILPADPAESGPGAITYTGPFVFGAPGNTYFFKVRAFKSGLAQSDVVQSGGIQIVSPSGIVETPSISPAGGTFNNPVSVTLATTTQFAQLVFTDDGTVPSTVIPISAPTKTYGAPFTLATSKTIKARGYRPFFEESQAASADFEFTCAPATATPSGGDLYDSVAVALSSITVGGTTKIRYTLDGTDPTELSPQYTAPIALGVGEYSLRARVFRDGFAPSSIMAEEYTVALQPRAAAITVEPADQSVNEGTAAAFEVAADGSSPLSYGWTRNDVLLAGETEPKLTLENVQFGDAGTYRAIVSNSAGADTSRAAILTVSPSTSVRERREPAVPTSFDLASNYPNPFNPSTVIRFALPQAVFAVLEVFDAKGSRVKSLVREHHPAGYYEATWDGTNDAGSAVASGIYMYRLSAGPFTKSHKMLFVK
jgi:hypothetical protein